MKTLTSQQVYDVCQCILTAAGVADTDAGIIAEELRAANLVGHDSHGMIRLMQYVDYVEKGHIQPANQPEIVLETETLARLDAHFTFGQVAAVKALEVAMEKARKAGASDVTVCNCNHVGRLGSYGQRAAENGFAAVMVVNAPGPGGVVPFGGAERKLGTNPFCMAAPSTEGPFVLDMTSSATAEGKIRVAFQKGETVPEGWIVDSQGRPTTNPADLYADPPGALLPLGGLLGYKGTGLSMMIDVFGGILSGSGVGRTDLPFGANGVWMHLIDVEKLLPREKYDTWTARYREHIKSTRLREGVEEILFPGEIEQRRRQQREADGIPVADETWRQIVELGATLGVDVDGG